MRDIDVTIPNGSISLAGTFAPPSAPTRAAALLLSGSGPIDRDSNMRRLRVDVMRQVADHLAGAGIGSLRFDKRGVGLSEGDYRSTGFHDNVADARVALEVLRARPEVDPDRLFVIGHSEGALLATELAGGPTPIAGAVLLAGAARPGKEILRWQARQLAEGLPRPVKWLLKVLRQDVARTQAKRLARIEASTEDVIRIQGVRLNARWFREFMAYDPAESLAKAAVPILAVTGAKDIQVDPGDVARMAELVPTPFTGEVVDDVTHLFRSEEGAPSIRSYKKQVRRPVDPAVLGLLTDWISAHTGQETGADHERV